MLDYFCEVKQRLEEISRAVKAYEHKYMLSTNQLANALKGGQLSKDNPDISDWCFILTERRHLLRVLKKLSVEL